MRHARRFVAALATLAGVSGALPAFAQTTAAVPAGLTNAVAQKAADPCLRLESQALRMMQRCDAQPARDALLLTPATVPSADFTALRLPPVARSMQPGDNALLANSTAIYPTTSQPETNDVVVITAQRYRPQYDYIADAYSRDLEALYGNQPNDFEAALNETMDFFKGPLGDSAGFLVSSIGLRSLSGEARDAARDGVEDMFEDLFIGNAEYGGDRMMDPMRARDREWQQRMAQSFRDYPTGPGGRH